MYIVLVIYIFVTSVVSFTQSMKIHFLKVKEISKVKELVKLRSSVKVRSSVKLRCSVKLRS